MGARQRSRKGGVSRKAGDESTRQVENAEEQSESEQAASEDMMGSEDEAELERLVLGNEAGFKENLGKHMDLDSEEEVADDTDKAELEAEAGLEGVDDADLFFVDSGPSGIDPKSLVPHGVSEPGNGIDAPAWEDSDDDRLVVSLARDNRLRKLRINEDEDLVTGREYINRARRQFERLHSVPEWAQQAPRPAKRRRRSSAGSRSDISSDEDLDAENSDLTDLSTLPLARLLQDAGSLSRTLPSARKKNKLRPEVIDIQRTRDIPGIQPSSISSLDFHPEYPVLLSSGPASTLYLHHIDPASQPTPNPLLTSVHIRKTPLHTSAFLRPSGDKVFFSGRRRFFHTWDMPSGTIQKVTRVYGQKDDQKTMERFKLSPCGRYMALVGSSRKGGGIINVLDATTTQWIAAARVEGINGVADFAWWHDGEGLTIIGKGGDVGEWSISSRSFVARWMDDGHAPTVLALGGSNGPKSLGGDRWVVIGSQSGIVNIYDRLTFLTSKNEISIPERPTPRRAFDQLKRATSNLEISPDGQLLVLSTKWQKDGLRLVHLPSCTVFRNWPTDQTPLGKVTAVAFSSESDMLAVANEAGKIRLFEIRA